MNIKPSDGIIIHLDDNIKKRLFINTTSSSSSILLTSKFNYNSNLNYEHGMRLNKILNMHIFETLKINKYKIILKIPFNLIYILGLDSLEIIENFKFYFNNNFYFIANSNFIKFN